MEGWGVMTSHRCVSRNYCILSLTVRKSCQFTHSSGISTQAIQCLLKQLQVSLPQLSAFPSGARRVLGRRYDTSRHTPTHHISAIGKTLLRAQTWSQILPWPGLVIGYRLKPSPILPGETGDTVRRTRGGRKYQRISDIRSPRTARRHSGVLQEVPDIGL